MTDIVERLRAVSGCTQKTFRHRPDWEDGLKIITEAASEIERLRKALEPFAAYAVEIRPECLDHQICGPSFRVGAIRAAAAALSSTECGTTENIEGGA